MRHRKINRHAGFTLAELLIVVAIIAILAAIAIPVFSSSLATAEERVCETNRRSLQSLLSAAATDTSLPTGLITAQYQNWDTVKDQFAAAGYALQGDDLCPAGGTLSIRMESGGGISVACTVHHPNNMDLRESFTAFVQEQITKNPQNNNNSNLRMAFFEENGNRWPTVTYEGTTYQIEPYYVKSTGDIWLFARVGDGSDLGNGNWNAALVYDPTDKTWYQPIHSYDGRPVLRSITFSDLAALHKAVQNQVEWKAVDFDFSG